MTSVRVRRHLPSRRQVTLLVRRCPRPHRRIVGRTSATRVLVPYPPATRSVPTLMMRNAVSRVRRIPGRSSSQTSDTRLCSPVRMHWAVRVLRGVGGLLRELMSPDLTSLAMMRGTPTKPNRRGWVDEFYCFWAFGSSSPSFSVLRLACRLKIDADHL
ncbi:hypothetical protein K474DRAFT_337221 [Panus rudis PR-1116 ss-1]|nr:hypothetical protein K474DRAFT_337221 [Panus rudis PR-1116 ss-1]